MRRILCVSHSSYIGGAENSFLNILRILSSLNYEIYSAVPHGPLFSKTTKKSAKTIKILPECPPRKMFNLKIIIFYCLTFIVNFTKLTYFILVNDFDYMFINSSVCLSALLVAFIFRKPAIVFIREDYYYQSPFLRRLLLLGISKVAQKVLLQTNKTAEDYKLYSFKNNYQLLYDGVYGSFLNTEAEKRFDFSFGVIGKIYPLKGQDVFVGAFKLLYQKYPFVKGFIIGGVADRKYYEGIKRYIDQNNLSKAIAFTGERRDMNLMFPQVDVIIISSYSEGCPLVFSEALYCNKIVISTRTGVMVDVATDGQDILFFEFGSVEDLFQKMEKLVVDPILRDTLRLNGGRVFFKCFDKNNIEKNYSNIFEQLGRKNKLIVSG